MDAQKKPPQNEAVNPNDAADSDTHDAPAQAPHDSGESEDTRFAALAARYALAGHALVRAQPGDGVPTPLYALRWGWCRPLASLDDAERWLRQIGGAA